MFVVSRGGGPNAVQRREIISALFAKLGAAAQMTTAVCSDSPLARGITKAIGWMTSEQDLRSFGYQERQRALTFLKVPLDQGIRIILLTRRFERELAASHLPVHLPVVRARREVGAVGRLR